MQFRGPEQVDLTELREINEKFLELLATGEAGSAWLPGVPERLANRLQSLSSEERRRLAQCPFLLCSCREDDIDYWRELLQREKSADLFSGSTAQSPDVLCLKAGVIGFTWQLARRNVFAARLLAGASSAWCEEIAAHPLLSLIDTASQRADSLRLRLVEDGRFWEQLLRYAVSNDVPIRRAARMGGLQKVLLATQMPSRLLLAAKTTTPPRQRRR